MKQKKRLCMLVFALLWLPRLLFAQKSDDFLKMKPGDWFDVLVSDTARMRDGEGTRYNIHVSLVSIDASGNKEWTMEFERIRMGMYHPAPAPLRRFSGPVLGHDTYYPPYQQGIEQRLIKPLFKFKTSSLGKVLSIKKETTPPDLPLHEISYLKNSMSSISASVTSVHQTTAERIFSRILNGIADNDRGWYNGQLDKKTWHTFLVTSASFPLGPNVLIEGKISNINQKVRDGLSLYLPGSGQEFRIAKDGSFKLSTFLSESTAATLRYRVPVNTSKNDQSYPSGVDVRIASQEWEIPLFLRPGDTLKIDADGKELIKSMKFRGKPSSAAELGLELAKVIQNKKTPEIPYSPISFSAQDFMRAQETDRSNFLKVLELGRVKVGREVYKFHELKFTFEQANVRLDFLSKTRYLVTPNAPETFEGYPEQFFLAIDTLPVLMIDYTQANWYYTFLNTYKMYTLWKAGKYNGGASGFFLGDYVLSLNYFRRYPLYLSLADAFENELGENSWKSAQSLKSYYDDFMNNCGDTVLTSTVKEKWEALSKWAPGNLSPLKSIRLADGSSLNLSKFKGKALSITFNYHYPDEIKRLLDRIKKQKGKDVHFLIVQLKEDGYPVSTITEEIKKLPEVTYVEVDRETEDIEDAVLLSNFDVKTFVFDAEQRIIEDNIDDSPNHLPKDEVFEEALKRALSPKKMSEEDKAELIRTTGWSLGSTLFAGLMFFWIYKVRINAIKRKEALNRQIKELEIKAIRSQMNPHFMFNALNSIQSLINNHQYKESNVYLEKFSLLMRRVLNNSEKTFVSLSDELDAVMLYVELEKLRFDFSFSINVNPDINTELIEIPGMIIQPLVENAILHGIAQKGNSGKLAIQISNDQKCLKIEVKDNGLGLKRDLNSHEDNGFGLKLVKQRLNLLNEQGADGKLNISPNLGENESGVTATLTIPID